MLARLAAGEMADSGAHDFRAALRFETGAGDVDWLNRVITISTGVRQRRAVELRVFERP